MDDAPVRMLATAQLTGEDPGRLQCHGGFTPLEIVGKPINAVTEKHDKISAKGGNVEDNQSSMHANPSWLA